MKKKWTQVKKDEGEDENKNITLRHYIVVIVGLLGLAIFMIICCRFILTAKQFFDSSNGKQVKILEEQKNQINSKIENNILQQHANFQDIQQELSQIQTNNFAQKKLSIRPQRYDQSGKLQRKKTVVTEQHKKRRNKLITEQQLKFSIQLMEQLNGRVVYQKIHSSNSIAENSQSGINSDPNDYKQNNIRQVEQLIQKERLYYQQKYAPSQFQKQLNSKQSKTYLKKITSQLSQQIPERISLQQKAQVSFCLVIPSFNNTNKKLYKRNINSIVQQQYSNYHVVYIDDASPDKTLEFVIDYLNQIYHKNQTELRSQTSKVIDQSTSLNFTITDNNTFNSVSTQKQTTFQRQFEDIKWDFIKNSQRQGALHNIYTSIHKFCQDNQIVIIIDGDDALVGTQVLPLLNQVYKHKQPLFLYSGYAVRTQELILQESNTAQKMNGPKQRISLIGQKNLEHNNQKAQTLDRIITYEVGPAGMQIPINSLREKTFRQKSSLLASHLLTFYAQLFKKIDKSYFIDPQSNKFFAYAYDRALTLPLIQLTYQKTLYLKQILYQYRNDTGINDPSDKWAETSLKIRNKKPLQKLTGSEIEQMQNKVLTKQQN